MDYLGIITVPGDSTWHFHDKGIWLLKPHPNTECLQSYLFITFKNRLFQRLVVFPRIQNPTISWKNPLKKYINWVYYANYGYIFSHMRSSTERLWGAHFYYKQWTLSDGSVGLDWTLTHGSNLEWVNHQLWPTSSSTVLLGMARLKLAG